MKINFMITKYFNNIQFIQNINLLSILFLSKLFFDFPILYSEIFIVFFTIIISEYIFNVIFKRKKTASINSAINTGAGILFFLKTSNPIYFVFASIISILSKYVIKYKGRHFLNPSNIGLVLTFLIFPNNVWLIGEQWERNYFFIGYIILFGIYILYKLRYLTITIGFLITTVIGTYLFLTPSINAIIFNITNIGFILFGLYMITDPAVVPKKINKLLYGGIIGLIYIILQYYLSASYTLLLSLTLISLLHPFIYKYGNKILYGLSGILISILGFNMLYGNNISQNIQNIQTNEINKKLNEFYNKNNKEINLGKIDNVKINNNGKFLDFQFENNNLKENNKLYNLGYENNKGKLDFKKDIILREYTEQRLGYYTTNNLEKNSLTTGYFNNDKYLDFFTTSTKGLLIGIYNKETKNFDLNFIERYSKYFKTENIFYRSVDYNFDGLYDIITNDNDKFQLEVYINKDGKGLFEKHKLNLFFEGLQGLGYADINNDLILDFIVPSNCENIDIKSKKCKGNFVYLSDTIKNHNKTIKDFLDYSNIKYKTIDLDKNPFKNKDIDLKGPTLTSVYGELYKGKQLYIGNDFYSPDLIYNFDKEKNKLYLDKNFKEYIPATTFQTMSCDTGDVNNDGKFDLFCTEMLFQDNIYNQKVNNKNNCQDYKDNKKYNQYLECIVFENVANSVNNNDLQGCLDTKDEVNDFLFKNNIKINGETSELLGFQIGLCINQVIMDSAKKTLNEKLCSKIDDSYLKNICYNKITEIKEKNADITMKSNDLSIFPKQKYSNILLINSDNGFKEETNKYNIKRSDWSWNSVFFDINNDNYLDNYVANGNISNIRMTPNHLFLNKHGETFKEFHNEIINHKLPTYTYNYGDYDRDGDIDILLKDGLGNIYLYENLLGGKNTKAIRTNIYYNKKTFKNIPNIVYRFYNKDNKLLFSREQKLSGGYNSLNSLDLYYTDDGKIDYIIIEYDNIKKKIYNKDLKLKINDIILEKLNN